MAEMAAAETSNARLLSRVLSLLSPDEQGRLSFNDDGLAKVSVIIEVAAQIEDGAPALFTLVRLLPALEDKGHPEAADQLTSCFRSSTAALERLRRLRSQSREVSAAFDRFADRKATKQAPRHDVARPPETISLKDLLPPGAGRRPPTPRRPQKRNND